MISYFRVGNKILDIGLSLTALRVAVYMISLSQANKKSKETYCFVKQSTIGEACACTRQTVAKAIVELKEKGLITQAKRITRKDRLPGTTAYNLCLEQLGKRYFKIDRKAFTQTLSNRGFKAFLFISRSICMKMKLSWNSYKDLSEMTGFSRSDSIKVIDELIKEKIVHRTYDKKGGLHFDNIYRILKYVRGYIKKKSNVFAHIALENRSQKSDTNPSYVIVPQKKKYVKGVYENKVVNENSRLNFGGGENLTSYILPTNITIRRKNIIYNYT